MESLQTTKNRLRAVKNVGQITKAMEVVAATKMRRAQEIALHSRPYAFEALRLLDRLVGSEKIETGGYFNRVIKKTHVLILSSDRGLAGSFNSQIFKLADYFFSNDQYRKDPEHQYFISVVGKKAMGYCLRKKYSVVKNFDNLADVNQPAETAQVSNFLLKGFLSGEWDRVIVISTNFRTALIQEPLLREILPLNIEKIKETIKNIIPESGKYAEEKTTGIDRKTDNKIDYLFEPSQSEVLEVLLPYLLDMQVYHLFLEAKASEHSARRVAMKTASDNSIDLSEQLTLDYNKIRQVGITRELSEITTTIMTLE